ncbi:Ribonuclease HI (EC 3.1.26.4) [uncultured Gammaproteobacteria bacterium]|uniref:ribonuclease HI n=1 Tax=Bathymodiolus heckerae thiotrophic gill symbiont TaxID=1052212 RepID=UPI0010B45D83|nr:ribonuclease HI [Bathymodiolus heckerae thiotrophic gill symbiont]CAC9582981.1 Ribonuclease HI (EC 3.1.26.4) [uncultured Gammaproteobacteria bacterium]CAC9600797.1 Ribonuclease HI (EC 3.1.26.4) [uncultured Gammaproteobacteria bacterium]SHN91384.1 Ribonuclease HI [Bathymodiolus heckerae thiotrophic gill symbiont]
MEKIVIYTDGGCRGNPGIGGWGVWLRYGDHDKKLKGSEKDTTNNRMELMAAIKALEAIKSKDIDINLFTDSKYVMNGINDWIKGWKAKGWKTAAKKPVKNVDLWQRLDTLNASHTVHWHWVKGHSGDEGNEMADELANQAMDSMN